MNALARGGWRGPLRLVLRLALGGIFLFAGAAKAGDPSGFAASIAAYRVVGMELALPLARYLPWLEIVCGLALIAGWRGAYRGGLIVSALLLALFAGALAQALARGLDIECGCFGAGVKNGPAAELGLVVAMAFALFALVRCGMCGGNRVARHTRAGG